MKRYLILGVIAVVLAAAILLALPLLKKDEPAQPAPDSLSRFMEGWSIGFVDDMLSACAPSWKAQQANPELRLFQLMANRTVTAWNIGAPARDGDALLYPVDVLLRNSAAQNGGWQRCTLRVVTENDKQYVVPDGIAACEPVAAPKTYVAP